MTTPRVPSPTHHKSQPRTPSAATRPAVAAEPRELRQTRAQQLRLRLTQGLPCLGENPHRRGRTQPRWGRAGRSSVLARKIGLGSSAGTRHGAAPPRGRPPALADTLAAPPQSATPLASDSALPAVALLCSQRAPWEAILRGRRSAAPNDLSPTDARGACVRGPLRMPHPRARGGHGAALHGQFPPRARGKRGRNDREGSPWLHKVIAQSG